jgi:hypothetical protein
VNAHATEARVEEIRAMVTAHRWDTETAIVLVLEYLHQGPMATALDALITGVAHAGKGPALIEFLQDCVMTGTDHDVSRAIKDMRSRVSMEKST